jgi:hypothetical protein
MTSAKRTRRVAALALGQMLLVAAAACTDGDDDGSGSGATGASGSAGPTGATGDGPTPVSSGSATSGTYEYENAGLRVILEIDGTAGTMEVHNDTDHELGEPSFYIRGAVDGARIDGTVATPAPVPAGDTATFDVSFEGIRVGEIGGIALLFGEDNYGLFVRTG